MIDVDRIIGEGESIVYSDAVSNFKEELNGQFMLMGRYVHYFYALIDPQTKEIIYVGKTNNPPRRYEQHRSNPENHSGNIPKSIWIDSLNRAGIIPIMYVLDCREMWHPEEKTLEKNYIQQFWNEGHPLVNHQAGWMRTRNKKVQWRERLNNSQWATARRNNGGMLETRRGIVA